MTMIKVPLQCHQSAIESAIEIRHHRRSKGISAISAVKNRKPAPCAGKVLNAKKLALMALIHRTWHLTCKNVAHANGTATALPSRGAR